MSCLQARPTADEVLEAVATAFGPGHKRVLDRAHQPAFQLAVFLLRRVCNLPLKEVSAMAGVSPSRISKIQGHIERGEASGPMKAVLNKYKLKH